MKAEAAALRQGYEEARREVVQAARTAGRQAAPTEEELIERLEASIEKMVQRAVDGRLAGLEPRSPRRVSRPPLAGDSSEVARAARAAIEEASGSSPAPRPARPVQPAAEELEVRAPARPAPRQKGAADAAAEWGPFGPSTSTAVVDADAYPELPWVEVTGRGGKGKGKGVGKKSKPKPKPTAAPSVAPATRRKAPSAARAAPRAATPGPVAAPTAAHAAAPAKKRRKKRLSAPSSSAVVLKLQPEAAQNGATYASALLTAEQEVNLEELGIGSLRIRPSATGARLIEVPGSSSGDKADALASALRVALAGVVEVTRPVKTADFRVTGLNDAATAQRVKAAVAKAGGCAEEQVWVGELRPDWRGSRSALMRCPVTAAKKLLEAGSISVGWGSAQLRHLEARPMHCYKCMGKGHTAALCPSQADRSQLCYRCGEAGHLSASCTAKPRCAVCHAAGKPADHVMGGRSCNPPSQRGKGPSPPPRGDRQEAAPVGQMEE